ncbi:uncharacterized protein LOC108672694 [Hyalella azteca]|uniref:Uncharacterized protein LOC108672694 n=1 Tax=Hyalella azteca TaxID=294128 RepID=A0A8B7NQ90_HYAAZ|nr:uncharacterized protein LOC108672694 [Hyalella azteca]
MELSSENIGGHIIRETELPLPPKDSSHVALSGSSQANASEPEITTFRRRKRSYDSCDSDSDDGSNKCLKLDYDSDSVGNCLVKVSDRKFDSYAGLSSAQRWKGKYQFLTSYSLRPRQRLRKCWSEGDADIVSNSGSRKGSRCRMANRVTLSKYRRNTANARERERMREINSAFTTLRGVLPRFATAQMASMTKITTLQLASSYIRALSNMLKESEKDNLMNDGTHQKTSASSSVGRPNLAPHEFNNNTSLSNMNFESEDKKNSAWDVKFESKENTSCSDEAAAGADFSLDTFLAREAADASSCAVAGPRLQPNSDDQQHNDEEIILWNDISSDQNFNWDSN